MLIIVRPLLLSAALGAALLPGCRVAERIEAPAAPGPVVAARVALGQALFFDPRLSRRGDVACASCHQPAHGGAEPRAVSEGTGGQPGRRNAPSVLPASLKTSLFWDGRAETLEAQALEPLLSPSEMDADPGAVRALLEDDPAYAALFDEAFEGAPAPSLAHVGAALAAYQRQLAWPGRVDRFLAGEQGALSPEERRGYDYFAGNCAFCHDGPGFGGLRLERLGEEIPWPEERSQDTGRMQVTGEDSDRLRFVVPSLRHVGETAPYFHDGSVETLEEAVRLMAHHQLGETLDETTVAEVSAFLRALDGDVPPELLAPPQNQ